LLFSAPDDMAIYKSVYYIIIINDYYCVFDIGGKSVGALQAIGIA